MTGTDRRNVVHNETEHRYELPLTEGVAVAEYERQGDTLLFTHTVVPEAAEGQGAGSTLVRAALEDVRSRGLRVVPLCPFVEAFVRRHPEFSDLLADAP